MIKKVIYFFLIINSSFIFAQKRIYSCEELHNTIKDTLLFKYYNGDRMIIKDVRSKWYKITSDKGISYIVGDSVAKDITLSIKLNQCEGILIEEEKPKTDIKPVRD